MAVEVPANAAMAVEGEIFHSCFLIFFLYWFFGFEFYVEIMCFIFHCVGEGDCDHTFFF